MSLQNLLLFDCWTLVPVTCPMLHESNSLNILESKLISNNNQMGSMFKSLRAHVQIKHHFKWSNNPSQWKLKEDLLQAPAGSCSSAWKEKMWTIMIKNKDLRFCTLRAECTGSTQQSWLSHLTGLFHQEPQLQLELRREIPECPQDGVGEGLGGTDSPRKPWRNSTNGAGDKGPHKLRRWNSLGEVTPLATGQGQPVVVFAGCFDKGWSLSAKTAEKEVGCGITHHSYSFLAQWSLTVYSTTGLPASPSRIPTYTGSWAANEMSEHTRCWHAIIPKL